MASDDVYLWDTKEQEEVFRCRVFSVDRCRMVESSGEQPPKETDFHVIRAPEWVNVVALTPKRDVVLIEQFRPGVSRITLELPGGMVDPKEPLPEAAARELAEETGYVAEHIEHIGCVEPNPALQSNRCHTFLATGARLDRKPSFDEHERIRVRTLGFEETLRATMDGRITHSLVVAALLHTRLYQEGLRPPP